MCTTFTSFVADETAYSLCLDSVTLRNLSASFHHHVGQLYLHTSNLYKMWPCNIRLISGVDPGNPFPRYWENSK